MSLLTKYDLPFSMYINFNFTGQKSSLMILHCSAEKGNFQFPSMISIIETCRDNKTVSTVDTMKNYIISCQTSWRFIPSHPFLVKQ